jgi:glycosyltransferase involved in cell wall biosynthesis
LKAEKIRILYVTSGLASGGKERQLIEVIKNLDKGIFTIGTIVLNKKQQYSKEALHYSDYYWELKRRPSRFEPLFSIWKCFRELKPDIIHTWDSLSSFYAYIPSRFYRIPFIDGSIRDAGVDKCLNYYFKKFFLKRANLIIANSLAGLKAYKIKGNVIYNGINATRFLPKVNSNEFNLIMTANFSKYKDHFTFLKAAIRLIKNDVVDQVFLLGDGPKKVKYIKWMEDECSEIRGKFHFLGNVKDVEKYLALCNVGILCSTTKYSEGISNSVLEYMAAGIIPIVTNIGGSSEIIENGINGYLIRPGDINEIINLVKNIKIINSLQERLIMNARTTIEEKFSMKKNLGLLTSIYKSLPN